MTHETPTQIIRKATLFRDLPEKAFVRVSQNAIERRFAPGEIIFNQGDKAKEVFVVLDGLVKLSTTSLAGDEIIVDVFSSGQSFAEALAFGDRDYPVTASVILAARVLVVPNQVIRDEIAASPEVTNAILASTYMHLHRLVQQIERLKGDSSLQRTARFILALGEERPGHVALPYNKQTIAAWIGVQPETLSRNFKKLEEYGVTISGNDVNIRDRQALRDLVFGRLFPRGLIKVKAGPASRR